MRQTEYRTISPRGVTTPWSVAGARTDVHALLLTCEEVIFTRLDGTTQQWRWRGERPPDYMRVISSFGEAAMDLVDEMGGGVSPECSEFAERLSILLDRLDEETCNLQEKK